MKQFTRGTFFILSLLFGAIFTTFAVQKLSDSTHSRSYKEVESGMAQEISSDEAENLLDEDPGNPLPVKEPAIDATPAESIAPAVNPVVAGASHKKTKKQSQKPIGKLKKPVKSKAKKK